MSLTAEQRRQLEQYSPVLSSLPPGIGLADILDAIMDGTGLDAAAVVTAAIADAAVTSAKMALASRVIKASATLGAEAGNAIAVTVATVDADGVAVNPGAAVRFHCRLYAATMIEALAAAFTMAETGAGTVVSTTAQAALLVDSDAAGAFAVTVTDVSGSFVGTVYLEITPVNRPGCPVMVAVVFA